MAFKLIESAQARWRAVNAPHLVALVRAGARFEKGKFVERPDKSGEMISKSHDTPIRGAIASTLSRSVYPEDAHDMCRARAGTTPPRWLGTGGWALVQNASSRSESTTRLWFVRSIVGHASCALGVSPVVDCCNDAGRR